MVEVAARLRRPLRIAIAGQVSAGKSTLVNALLGQRIAVTGVGEITRLFALYEFDENESIEIQWTDGRLWRRPLTIAGGLPTDWGVPLGDVDSVRVRLSTAGVLSRVTVVDAPGLGSATETASALTERRLFAGDGSTAEGGTELPGGRRP